MYNEEDNIIDQNRNVGTKVMVSILDLFLRNPYSSFDGKDID